MASNFNSRASSTAAAPAARKPADKWVNLSLPTEGGGKAQIIGLPIDFDVPAQKELWDLIEAEGVEAFRAALIIETRDGKRQESSRLSFKKAA